MYLEKKVSYTVERAFKARAGVELQLFYFFNLGARWGRLANVTPRPPYPLGNRSSTHYAVSRVGPKGGLCICGKSCLHRDSISGLSSPQRVAIPTELTWPVYFGAYCASNLTAVHFRSEMKPYLEVQERSKDRWRSWRLSPRPGWAVS